MLHLTTMLSDYQEIDPSAMASQTQKFFEELDAKNPTLRFAAYCEEYPWALECKVFDL